MARHTSVRLLSLDGGGVRGLSSLLVLRHLMHNIDPVHPPEPCDYFDMIGGTGTGGIIAIMLGRLGLRLDDCIAAYTSLANEVFVQKKHRIGITGRVQGRFDSKALEKAIKNIIARAGLDPDALLKSSPDACKVFVTATSKETGCNVCFTSYRTIRTTHLHDYTKIWEACRATAAATTFFDPIAIGPFGEQFVDGALGLNNPVNEVWIQAQDVWGCPLSAKLGCMVSIGTGVPRDIAIRDDVLGMAPTLKRLVTETELSAERFRRDKLELVERGRYFRFNARGLEDIGLEEPKKRPEIIEATSRYVTSPAVSSQMGLCARALLDLGVHRQVRYK